MPPSRLINRNILAENGRTSMRLEPELWDALREICAREGITITDLVRSAMQTTTTLSGRTSAVRTYTLAYFRAATTEDGHARAGHGARPRQRRQMRPSRAPAARADHAGVLAPIAPCASALQPGSPSTA